MFVKYHIIIGLIASLALLLAFPQIGWFYALIIFFASFLLDFDHYLWYAVNKKDWNPLHAYKWMMKKVDFFRAMSLKERRKYKTFIMIFHGIECWIILILLTFVHKIFFFVLIGVAIHMILDFIDLYVWKTPFYIKTSQVYTHIKNKDKKEIPN